jgi:hypothetical protein
MGGSPQVGLVHVFDGKRVPAKGPAKWWKIHFKMGMAYGGLVLYSSHRRFGVW